MSDISLTQIEAAYALAEQVYDGNMTFEVAAASLREGSGLNINSARDFIAQFRHLVRGEVFKRSLSAAALEHFLSNIGRSRGREASEKAVSASWKHIAYYESTKKVRLTKLRAVVGTFQASLSGLVSAEVHESHFAAAVVQSSLDSAADRRRRIELAPARPRVVLAITKLFARNADVVAEVLARADGRCELCDGPAPFLRRSLSTPYLEVHHKVQLAHGGEDTVENAVAACPNCHRREHYGEP